MQKAENIKKNFSSIDVVPWESVSDVVKNMDIIINATSLGLKGGNDFKQEFRITKPNLIYYDIVYNPEETMMIKRFKKRNIQTFNGLEMFVYQGQKSFSLWNNVNPKVDEELRRAIISKLKWWS